MTARGMSTLINRTGMKKFWIILILLLSALIIYFIITYKDVDEIKRMHEEYYISILDIHINGKIIDKNIDLENHYLKRIFITQNNDTLMIALNFDITDLFERIRNNDSIFKEAKSNRVILKNESGQDTFYIDYMDQPRKILSTTITENK